MIRSVAAIIFCVSDLDAACGFYRDSLGLALVRKHSASGWAEFDVGGTRLALQQQAPHGGGDNPRLSLWAHNLDSTVEVLRSRGVAFVDETIEEQAFGRLIRLRDPDNNLITLFEGHG